MYPSVFSDALLSKLNCAFSALGVNELDVVLRFLCAKRSTNLWFNRTYSPNDNSVPKGAYSLCATRATINKVQGMRGWDLFGGLPRRERLVFPRGFVIPYLS
jgi:hypothetical protein